MRNLILASTIFAALVLSAFAGGATPAPVEPANEVPVSQIQIAVEPTAAAPALAPSRSEVTVGRSTGGSRSDETTVARTNAAVLYKNSRDAQINVAAIGTVVNGTSINIVLLVSWAAFLIAAGA